MQTLHQELLLILVLYLPWRDQLEMVRLISTFGIYEKKFRTIQLGISWLSAVFLFIFSNEPDNTLPHLELLSVTNTCKLTNLHPPDNFSQLMASRNLFG